MTSENGKLGNLGQVESDWAERNMYFFSHGDVNIVYELISNPSERDFPYAKIIGSRKSEVYLTPQGHPALITGAIGNQRESIRQSLNEHLHIPVIFYDEKDLESILNAILNIPQ